MSEKMDLKALERKMFTAYHEDGILDLIVAVDLLIFAMVMIFDQAAFIGMLAIPNVLYIPFKNQITIPRSGYVRFESEQVQKRKMSLTLVGGVAMFLGLIIFYGQSGNISADFATMIGENILLIFGAVMGLILAAIAFFMHCKRFYGYAGLGALLVWSAHFIGFHPGYGIAALGGVVLLMGIVILMRYLQEYPLQEAG